MDWKMQKINKKINILISFSILTILLFSFFTLFVTLGEGETDFDHQIELVKPEDGAYELTTNPELGVTVRHPEGDDMWVTFYGAEEGEEGVYLRTEPAESGDTVTYQWEGLMYDTTYEWYVIVEDENERNTISEFWTFSTEHIPNKVREPVRPEDGEIDVSANPELGVTVRHPEGDDMWVTFYGAEEGEDKEYLRTEHAESGDTVTYQWKNLNYDSIYEWYVIVEEDIQEPSLTKSDVWSFETKNFEAPMSPEHPENGETEVGIGPDMETTLVVEVEHPEDKQMDVIFYDGEGEEIDKDTDVGSGEEASVIWGGLDYATTYEWYVEVEDEKNTRKSEIWEFTTMGLKNLRVEVEGEGRIEVNGVELDLPYNEDFEPGTEVTLEAIPENGYVFEEWGGDYESDEKEITITMDEDKEITVHMLELFELTVQVQGEGVVEVEVNGEMVEEVENSWSENFKSGTEVSLTAIPGESRAFQGWTGDYEYEEKEITIEMDEDKEVTANIGEKISTISRVRQQIPRVRQQIPGFTNSLLILAAIFAITIYYTKSKK